MLHNKLPFYSVPNSRPALFLGNSKKQWPIAFQQAKWPSLGVFSTSRSLLWLLLWHRYVVLDPSFIHGNKLVHKVVWIVMRGCKHYIETSFRFRFWLTVGGRCTHRAHVFFICHLFTVIPAVSAVLRIITQWSSDTIELSNDIPFTDLRRPWQDFCERSVERP